MDTTNNTPSTITDVFVPTTSDRPTTNIRTIADLFALLSAEPAEPLSDAESDDDSDDGMVCCEYCGDRFEDEHQDRLCYECYGWQTCPVCDWHHINPDADRCDNCLWFLEDEPVDSDDEPNDSDDE